MWLKALFLFQKFWRVIASFEKMKILDYFMKWVIANSVCWKNEDIRLFYDCKW